MRRLAPDGLLGVHMNLLVTALCGAMLPAESQQERAAADAIATFRTSGFGYFLEQATRPQTIGFALLDSPVALATWVLDHDIDAYYKISRAFVDGQPSGGLTRDHILNNITPDDKAARDRFEGVIREALDDDPAVASVAIEALAAFYRRQGEAGNPCALADLGDLLYWENDFDGARAGANLGCRGAGSVKP